VRATNRAPHHDLRAHCFRGKVALTAHNNFDARTLEQAGVGLVLRPFRAAAKQATEALATAIAPATDRRD